MESHRWLIFLRAFAILKDRFTSSYASSRMPVPLACFSFFPFHCFREVYAFSCRRISCLLFVPNAFIQPASSLLFAVNTSHGFESSAARISQNDPYFKACLNAASYFWTFEFGCLIVYLYFSFLLKLVVDVEKNLIAWQEINMVLYLFQQLIFPNIKQQWVIDTRGYLREGGVLSILHHSIRSCSLCNAPSAARTLPHDRPFRTPVKGLKIGL